MSDETPKRGGGEKPTAAVMLKQILAACEARDRTLERWVDMIARYSGPAYPTETNGTDYDPEAFAFEYVALTLPRLAYANPRVAVSSRAVGPDARRNALMVRYALNLWAPLVDFAMTAERMATDFLFAHSVAMVLPRPVPWYRDGGPDDMPRVVRINPGDFFLDQAALHHSEATFMGHRWVVLRGELTRWAKDHPEEEWDLTLIERLGGATETVERATETEPDRDLSDDDRIEVFQRWDADADSGTICCVARAINGDGKPKRGDQAGFIRARKPYKGPETGPYEVGGAYVVPNCRLPMSPLQAVDQQVQEHNDEARKCQEGVNSYQRGMLFGTAGAEAARSITNTKKKRKLVHTVAGDVPKDLALPFELGGVTPQMLEHLNLSRDRLDRVSGLDDAMRGSVTGKATATEQTIASGAGTLRQDWVASRFHAFCCRVLRKVGYFLWTQPPKAMALGPRATRRGTAEFSSTKSVDDFNALNLSIEPYSMGRLSEALQQQRGVQTVTLLGQLAQIMPMTPWVRWSEAVIPQLGDMLGMDLDEAIDTDAMELAAQQGAMQPPGGAVTQPQGPQTLHGVNAAGRRVR